MDTNKRSKLIENANEHVRINNEEYEYIDSIIKGAETILNPITKRVNELTHCLTSKYRGIYQLINPEALDDLMELMSYQKSIENQLAPYISKKNRLIEIGK